MYLNIIGILHFLCAILISLYGVITTKNQYDKVYLFLRNLSDTIPFGILAPQSNFINICNFNFDDFITLNKLEIVFTDEYGLDYNFYNLPHNLNFVIEKHIKI